MWVRACLVASVVSDSVTPWTVGRQSPLSTGVPRHGGWSGWLCPPPGDLPNPGIEAGRGKALSYLGINLPHAGLSTGFAHQIFDCPVS